MQFNFAALVPQLMVAMRPGANLKELAKSVGVEIQSISVGSEADSAACLAIAKAIRSAGSEVLFIHGSPAMLNGKKVQVLAVIGESPAQLDSALKISCGEG